MFRLRTFHKKVEKGTSYVGFSQRFQVPHPSAKAAQVIRDVAFEASVLKGLNES